MPYTPPVKTFDQSLNKTDSPTFVNQTLNGSLYFGPRLGQHINLFSGSGIDYYGVGIQYNTLYFRSDARFAWFVDGSHSDTQDNPGTGGSILGTWDSGGFNLNSNLKAINLEASSVSETSDRSFQKIGLFSGKGFLPGFPNDQHQVIKSDSTSEAIYFSINGVYSAAIGKNGQYYQVSDRQKKNPVDSDLDLAAILEKIRELPVDLWEYKHSPGERHIGTYAQDFYAAFGLGGDVEVNSPTSPDKTISALDVAGVSLAGIKGLYEKIKAQEAKITLLNLAVKELLDKR